MKRYKTICDTVLIWYTITKLTVFYKNDTPNCNPVDRDEGAERLGMGILLAKQYLLTHKPELKESLLKYVHFVRERLQTEDYTTYSSVDQKGRNRGYNYMWVAELYSKCIKWQAINNMLSMATKPYVPCSG